MQVIAWNCFPKSDDVEPKFVKCFANVGEVMTVAFKQYIEETKASTFPGEEHTYKIADEVIDKLK